MQQRSKALQTVKVVGSYNLVILLNKPPCVGVTRNELVPGTSAADTPFWQNGLSMRQVLDRQGTHSLRFNEDHD
jgi:hypothetical protein